MPVTPTRSPQRSAQRQRQHVNTDQFFVDERDKPQGISYEWKRVTYAGKEDVKNQNNMARNGFTPVPAQRHPDICGKKYAAEHPEGAIIVDGLMLMERPKELRQEADKEYLDDARSQVSNQVRRLKIAPDGHMERTGVKASRKFDIPVPESDSDE